MHREHDHKIQRPSDRGLRRAWQIIDYVALILAALAALALLVVLSLSAWAGFAVWIPGLPAINIEHVLPPLLIVIVAGSVAFGARHGSQIHVDVLGIEAEDDGLHPINVFSHLVSTLAVAVLVSALWQQGLCREDCGEFDALGIAHAPFYQMLALGLACYALMLLAELVSLLRSPRHD